MSLHPGEAGYEETFERKRKENGMEEPRTACGAMMAGSIEDEPVEHCNAGPTPRERRERPRMSDIVRSVDKYFGGVKITGTDKPCTYGSETTPPAYDKNTPGALKQLRWAIYELIDKYEGDYSGTLKQGVETLFQEYTHS